MIKFTLFSKRRFELTNSRTQVVLGMNQDAQGLNIILYRRFELTNSWTQVGLGMNQDSHAARQSGSEWTRCVSSLSSSHLALWVKYYTFLHHFCTSCMIWKPIAYDLVIQPLCTLGKISHYFAILYEICFISSCTFFAHCMSLWTSFLSSSHLAPCK